MLALRGCSLLLLSLGSCLGVQDRAADWVYSSNRCLRPDSSFQASSLLSFSVIMCSVTGSGYCLLSVGGGVNMFSPYQYNLCSSCYLPLWSQQKERGGGLAVVYGKCLIDMSAVDMGSLLFTLMNVSSDDESCKQERSCVCVCTGGDCSGLLRRPHRGYYQLSPGSS